MRLGHGFANAAQLRGATRRPLQADEGDPAQDEERRQRDDERREPGAQNDGAVEQADGASKEQGAQHGGLERPAPQCQWNADGHAPEGNHRADTQIELARDHQHRGGHGEDPELCAGLQEADDPTQRKHLGTRVQRKEKSDENGSCDRAKLRSTQKRRVPRTRVERAAGGLRSRAAQRRPRALSAITSAAFSRVTNPGPVARLPPGRTR